MSVPRSYLPDGCNTPASRELHMALTFISFVAQQNLESDDHDGREWDRGSIGYVDRALCFGVTEGKVYIWLLTGRLRSHSTLEINTVIVHIQYRGLDLMDLCAFRLLLCAYLGADFLAKGFPTWCAGVPMSKRRTKPYARGTFN